MKKTVLDLYFIKMSEAILNVYARKITIHKLAKVNIEQYKVLKSIEKIEKEEKV
jgi:hypothetical protein